MYKYIKGTTILSEDKMLSANEIAQNYYLWKPSDNLDKELVPNGTLVDYVIDKYRNSSNYKSNEYYYINRNNICFEVYPDELIEKAMKSFFKMLKDKESIKNGSFIEFEGIKFVYYKPKVKKDKSKVVDFSEYKETMKGSKKYD